MRVWAICDAGTRSFAESDQCPTTTLRPHTLTWGEWILRPATFPSAEPALNKAVSCDPTDRLTLVLPAYSEFMNRTLR